jgi:hypothetical protein
MMGSDGVNARSFGRVPLRSPRLQHVDQPNSATEVKNPGRPGPGLPGELRPGPVPATAGPAIPGTTPESLRPAPIGPEDCQSHRGELGIARRTG